MTRVGAGQQIEPPVVSVHRPAKQRKIILAQGPQADGRHPEDGSRELYAPYRPSIPAYDGIPAPVAQWVEQRLAFRLDLGEAADIWERGRYLDRLAGTSAGASSHLGPHPNRDQRRLF
jgi:hypothetical protein